MTLETAAPAGTRARNPEVKKWLAGHRPRLLINNSWVESKSGKTFETIDPVNEQVLAVAAEGSKADVDEAVNAARTAFDSGPWPRMSPHERAAILRRFADLIEAKTAELAELESLDNGMTLGLAEALVGASVGALHYFAAGASHVSGHTQPSASDMFHYTLREPIGVCGAITPWNGPIQMATWKIGPALAAGNTLVLKPAEQTPLTALFLAELAVEAGVPQGVLNVITGGPEAGAAVAEHPGIDKVAFTGSTETGKRILQASVGSLKRVSLELGGKSPNIVFPDADVEKALPASLTAFSLLSGQSCVSGTRLFVQRDFKDEFVEKLTSFTNEVKVGDPFDPETTMGPIASREQFDRVRNYLQIGKEEGATARTGGSAIDGTGFYIQPTIFDDVDNSMRIAREEIFGPVVSVIPFTDEYDAVLQGNDTQYGLGAAVWTKDISRAHAVAKQIKAGMVWVNNYFTTDPAMPFGGYKQSGIGNECGPNWYHHYTEEKAVFISL